MYVRTTQQVTDGFTIHCNKHSQCSRVTGVCLRERSMGWVVRSSVPATTCHKNSLKISVTQWQLSEQTSIWNHQTPVCCLLCPLFFPCFKSCVITQSLHIPTVIQGQEQGSTIGLRVRFCDATVSFCNSVLYLFVTCFIHLDVPCVLTQAWMLNKAWYL